MEEQTFTFNLHKQEHLDIQKFHEIKMKQLQKDFIQNNNKLEGDKLLLEKGIFHIYHLFKIMHYPFSLSLSTKRI